MGQIHQVRPAHGRPIDPDILYTYIIAKKYQETYLGGLFAHGRAVGRPCPPTAHQGKFRPTHSAHGPLPTHSPMEGLVDVRNRPLRHGTLDQSLLARPWEDLPREPTLEARDSSIKSNTFRINKKYKEVFLKE
ncbi:hypothetical protein H109_00238, partial [Trichophyton interdigitale MR816]